jgi:hypothetical protein
MALLKVWADTRGPANCRSCNAPITWYAMVKSGRRNPFDGEPAFVTTETDPVSGRLIGVLDSTTDPSHFATCPQSRSWRRA